MMTSILKIYKLTKFCKLNFDSIANYVIYVFFFSSLYVVIGKTNNELKIKLTAALQSLHHNISREIMNFITQKQHFFL